MLFRSAGKIYRHMAPYPKVIAVGGGGFTHAVDPSLEDFIVAASGCSRPRIGFIGTASEDDPVKIRRFYERCAPLADQLTHLPVSSDAVAAAHWSDALDIIYVGSDMRIAKIRRNFQPCKSEPCELDASPDGVLYVLEVPGGWCEKWGVKVGQPISLSPSP